MKLVIGGASQGKRAYAAEYYGDDFEIIADFHLLILELLKKGASPVEYMNEHLPEYEDKVIICDDIFCGVVPEDPLMRRWRESLGNVIAVIAKESDEVVRVFCGLGVRLK